MSAAKTRAAAAAAAPEPAAEPVESCASCGCYMPSAVKPENVARAAERGIDIGRCVCHEGPQPFQKAPHDWCGRWRPRKETRP
jgi:hypothetical protein